MDWGALVSERFDALAGLIVGLIPFLLERRRQRHAEDTSDREWRERHAQDLHKQIGESLAMQDRLLAALSQRDELLGEKDEQIIRLLRRIQELQGA